MIPWSPSSALSLRLWIGLSSPRGKLGVPLADGLLTDLLAATVTALQADIPGLGEIVACDVKHLYAWVPRKQ